MLITGVFVFISKQTYHPILCAVGLSWTIRRTLASISLNVLGWVLNDRLSILDFVVVENGEEGRLRVYSPVVLGAHDWKTAISFSQIDHDG